jgi:DNA polymerase III alpha subunit (gram-positive type)
MTNNLGENLTRYNYKKKTFCFSDSETESLNLFYSRPWSFAWITCHGDQIIEKHNRFLWFNDLKVSADAARITGFNFQEYKDKAEDPAKVLKELSERLYDPSTINVMHNGLSFDAYQINNWRRSLGLKPDYSFLNHFVDTNCIAKLIKLNMQVQEPLLNQMYKLSNFVQKGLKTSLTTLSKQYGFEVDESQFHGALYDSEITRQIFFKQIWECELAI